MAFGANDLNSTAFWANYGPIKLIPLLTPHLIPTEWECGHSETASVVCKYWASTGIHVSERPQSQQGAMIAETSSLQSSRWE